MWKSAAVVALIQVEKSGQPEAKQVDRLTIVSRIHDVTVVEAIKLSGLSGRSLKIAQLGGSATLHSWPRAEPWRP
jgi:hypothetical protein